jgi:Ca2+-binding EF-hand superfamily protein
MRKTRIAALGAMFLAGSIGLAAAQPAPPPPGPPGGPGGPGWQGGHRGHGDGPHHGRRGSAGFAMGEAFARADANNDGRVSREEGQAWLQARFVEIDADRDGGVTIAEVRTYMEAQRPAGRRGPPARAQERMQQRGAAMFRFVDVNLDGKVSMDELRPMFEAAFRAADRDSDGALSRDEVRMRGAGGPGRRGGQPGQPGAPAAPAQPR